MSSSRFSGTNQRIADRLLAERRIGREQHQRVIDYSTARKARVEDALVELDILSEQDLLKFIATIHNTRFVSSEKLSKAGIDQRILQRVPLKTAELHGIFPVLYDEKAGVLSVVTADPDNDVAIHEVKLAAGVRDIRCLVARPAAVRAAIAFHYRNDRNAFGDLLRPTGYIDLLNEDPFERRPSPRIEQRSTPPKNIDPYGRQNSATQMRVPTPAPQPAVQPPAAPVAPPGATMPGWPGATMPGWPGATMPGWPGATMPGWMAAAMTGAMPGAMPGTPMPGTPMPGAMPGTPMPAQPTPAAPAPAPAAPALAPTPVAQTPAPPPPSTKSPAPPSSPKASTSSTVPAAVSPEVIETLNVLVSLLENSRADLRGHSSTVARLTRKTCERIGLGPIQTLACVAAAYLHDLGKMGTYHLTPLNVAEYEGHRVAATKSVELPVHLMESVGLLPDTISALSSMYERYDGQGFPYGQVGKDIPIGARVLAVADTYADLTQNPRNPYRKILRPFEACEVLAQFRGTVFDPNIVDLFRHAMTGEDMRAKLLSDRHEVLIIDPDPEETTVLELRLIEHGFDVRIARTAAQAKKLLESGEINVVVSEIDVDKPEAGLALRESALKEGFAREAIWVVLTAKTDRQTAQRAFELGVADFVTKPISSDIFAAKLRQLVERRPVKEGGRGVSGSLAEMSLPDMVQILWHGRKTGALKIITPSISGEIAFADGMIVHAKWDTLTGEDAFYKMLTVTEGDFRLEPNVAPSERTVMASPEALLLEGMRRIDEAAV